MVLVIFLVELILLFFISQELTKHLSRVFYRLFHKESIVIHILSFLFLPGVILHELSHFFMASILLVPTGEIEFLPEVHGNEVKMGSVAIGTTDPLRRFVIGVAPLVMGLGTLFLLFWYIHPETILSWQTAFLFYCMFEISNTMFSSKKDMEGAIGLLIAFCLILFLFFFAGFRLSFADFSFLFTPQVVGMISPMNGYLFVALFLDSVVILLSLLLVKRLSS